LKNVLNDCLKNIGMFQINKPVIVVNFKTYEQSVSENALSLAKVCEDVSKDIVVCVDAIDLREVADGCKIPVFAQHVDGVDFGSHTGKILPEVVRDAGAVGSIINHSEDRYALDALENAITDCKKEGIFSLVCCQNATEAKAIAAFSPDAIAIEPPELIGGDVSVTSADPKIVSDSVAAVKEVNPDIPVLCGAGVKTKEDVVKSIELGAMGVLLASGVTKAKEPKVVLADLFSGL
jgi:triosephosphate isomerase